MKEIRLEGVSGVLDLASLPRRTDDLAFRWLPADFVFQANDFQVRQGDCNARATGFFLSGKGDSIGEIAAREVRAEGPGFESVFNGWHGQTFWKGERLTLTGLDLGHGVSLASVTLDVSRLGRGRLGWDGLLTANNGEARSQGSVDFSHGPAMVEIAATMRRMALAPLARILGVRSPVEGQVEQAAFTFRGNPRDSATAQMSLSARTTDFRCGDRGWRSLDAQAVVVNRRLQLHRFDLCQNGNSVSLSGEFPLPTGDLAGLAWIGDWNWWQAAGFSCKVDARLDDLHALAELIGPAAPDLTGRLSVTGQFGASPGQAGIDGYLNAEGARLTLRGAPLDYLRTTLLFRDGTMEVTDVQATHDADYLTAHGVVGLSGEHAVERRGEARAEIKDLSVYAPALAAFPGIAERIASTHRLDAVLRLENGEWFFEQENGAPSIFALAR